MKRQFNLMISSNLQRTLVGKMVRVQRRIDWHKQVIFWQTKVEMM